MKSFHRIFAVAGIVTMLASCSGSSGIPPSSPAVTTGIKPSAAAPSAASVRSYSDALRDAQINMALNQKAPDVFERAAGLDLTAAQIGNYVDPSVQGVDRQNAVALMSLMPKQLRGDFVYQDQSGHLVSNNPAILPLIKLSTTVAGRTLTRLPRIIRR